MNLHRYLNEFSFIIRFTYVMFGFVNKARIKDNETYLYMC